MGNGVIGDGFICIVGGCRFGNYVIGVNFYGYYLGLFRRIRIIMVRKIVLIGYCLGGYYYCICCGFGSFLLINFYWLCGSRFMY